MDKIHHWTFQGVDTSHFVTPKEGDTKIIGEVEYEYVMVNGSLKLIPIYELPEKRDRRAISRRNYDHSGEYSL